MSNSSFHDYMHTQLDKKEDETMGWIEMVSLLVAPFCESLEAQQMFLNGETLPIIAAKSGFCCSFFLLPTLVN